ncbi:hypothetical protein [Streptomyces sp. NBC_00989]|uniref:hypothetical protein n=1 Tax=Streptomyces sp. NBC_00989 TaxID=2903705 RepID=UPI0038647B40|nr:hypothetical protein OG714_12825 [Streptomyces sp. NBC_00989]
MPTQPDLTARPRPTWRAPPRLDCSAPTRFGLLAWADLTGLHRSGLTCPNAAHPHALRGAGNCAPSHNAPAPRKQPELPTPDPSTPPRLVHPTPSPSTPHHTEPPAPPAQPPGAYREESYA